MGTRANIGISYKGTLITTKHINMDGHLENWAGTLIAALTAITPEELIKASSLLKFMTQDNFYSSGEGDWGCEVEIKDNQYEITITNYGETVFVDSLEKFASEYNFLI